LTVLEAAKNTKGRTMFDVIRNILLGASEALTLASRGETLVNLLVPVWACIFAGYHLAVWRSFQQMRTPGRFAPWQLVAISIPTALACWSGAALTFLPQDLSVGFPFVAVAATFLCLLGVALHVCRTVRWLGPKLLLVVNLGLYAALAGCSAVASVQVMFLPANSVIRQFRLFFFFVMACAISSMAVAIGACLYECRKLKEKQQQLQREKEELRKECQALEEEYGELREKLQHLHE
jgi:hypothetical protein